MGKGASEAHVFLGDDAWDAPLGVPLPNGESTIVVTDECFSIRAEGQIEEVASSRIEALTCRIKQTAIWKNSNIAGYNLCLARACWIAIPAEVNNRSGGL